MKNLSISFVFLTLGFYCFAQTSKSNPQKSPNIVFILVDDLGYADVGFNGCKDIPTPNIDLIADEGVKFTEAYVTYPVCGPSRAGIITGRYQDRFGFGRNPLFAPNDPNMGLPLSEETMADVLKKANYKSVALGKWHLGAHESLHPLKRGFDDFFGFLNGGHSYFPEMWVLQTINEVKSQYDAYNTKIVRGYTPVEETEYLTDALSREAINYIEKYKNEPFFIYLAYNAPHSPMQATKKYLDRFPNIQNEKRRTYAAMVSAVDDGVGNILKKLDELNLAENTMVIFLSDNGGPEHVNGSDNGILRGGKSDLFEGGVRVPFAMKWPKKIPKGVVYTNAVISLDIFATAMAQTQKPIQTKNQLDGVNLIPFVNGENNGTPHELLWWRKFDHNQFAIRNSKGEKFVKSKSNTHLFDLKSNISEVGKEALGNEILQQTLLLKYTDWEKQMLDPVFLGLMQDKEYSQLNPNRFE
jgi:arylsulfatase A-like enzyme